MAFFLTFPLFAVLEPTMDSGSLITDAVKNDPGALESLLREYRPWMIEVVRRSAGADLLHFLQPDDIVQDAMASAFRSIADLTLGETPQKNFEAWLSVVVRNAIAIQRRKRRHALKMLHDEIRDAAIESGPSPSRQQRRQERYGRLTEAIQKLSESHRIVIELQIKGLTLDEIAAAVSQTRAAVNSRLARARQELHLILGSTSENISST